jgi:hypothetical protein
MTASPAIVVAQMWDGNDHMDGGWWWVMGIGWLIFLKGPGPGRGRDSRVVVPRGLESRWRRPPGQVGTDAALRMRPRRAARATR